MSADRHDAVTQAALRADRARQRLLATLGEVRHRLNPEVLAQEALDSATQGALVTARSLAGGARSRPWTLALLAGTITLFAAWRQVGQALAGRRHAAGVTDTTPSQAKQAFRSKKGS